jgi:hypothetical protein
MDDCVGEEKENETSSDMWRECIAILHKYCQTNLIRAAGTNRALVCAFAVYCAMVRKKLLCVRSLRDGWILDLTQTQRPALPRLETFNLSGSPYDVISLLMRTTTEARDSRIVIIQSIQSAGATTKLNILNSSLVLNCGASASKLLQS